MPVHAQEQARPEVEMFKDVVFGKGGKQELKLDLARPKEGEGPFPAIVCIHGGGWVRGDRKQLTQTVEALARSGFVAVTIDYRLAPEYHFPAPIEDCKTAVRWLRANAKDYRIDTDRIGVVGFAAGAHLACLLGVTGRDDGLEGSGGNAEQSSRVQAVASFFGPTDLAWPHWNKEVVEGNLVPLLGGTLKEKPELYRKASPLTYARKDAPAFLFFHGTEDQTIPLEQSERFATKLHDLGNTAILVKVEGEGHTWKGQNLLACMERMLTFFNEQLKR
jgi:acetyl esterase/lipase